MKKVIKDERITKTSNKIASKMYYLLLALTFIEIIIKLQFTKSFHLFILEILAIIISIGYLSINLKMKGLLFSSISDEAIIEVKQKLKATAFMICFWFYVIGEFLLMLLFPKDIFYVMFYIALLLIPSFIVTIYSIKNGLLIWGSKKNKEVGTASLKKSSVIGSIFFGIFIGLPYIFVDGSFNPISILIILGMACGFGFPFYFIFKLLISKSEKAADKQLLDAQKLDTEKLNGDFNEK